MTKLAQALWHLDYTQEDHTFTDQDGDHELEVRYSEDKITILITSTDKNGQQTTTGHVFQRITP